MMDGIVIPRIILEMIAEMPAPGVLDIGGAPRLTVDRAAWERAREIVGGELTEAKH